jgi:hypothetical protein
MSAESAGRTTRHGVRERRLTVLVKAYLAASISGES